MKVLISTVLLMAYVTYCQADSVSNPNLKVSGFVGKTYKHKYGIVGLDHVRCPSSSLKRYVDAALSNFSGTDDAQGIAKQITSNVLANYDGAWVTITSQLNYDDFVWAYWGSNPIYSSSNFCFVVTDKWLVELIKVAV